MMQRTPEPELMDAPEQARAYAEADFSEPNTLFVAQALWHLDKGSSGRMIDLGCGPAEICIRFARALPDWHITGLDAGPNMLSLARAAVETEGLADRIDLVEALLPKHRLASRFDAVVSNSLLHHLPDPMTLWQSIVDLASPGAFVQVMDLNRPASEVAARATVEEKAAGEPQVLRQDFFNSLLAAWTADEVAEQLRAAGLETLELSRPTELHWLVQGRLAHT